MRVHCFLAALFAALLIPLGASAQTAFEGLDLSSLSSEQPAAEDSASSGDFGGFGLDLKGDESGDKGASSAKSHVIGGRGSLTVGVVLNTVGIAKADIEGRRQLEAMLLKKQAA